MTRARKPSFLHAGLIYIVANIASAAVPFMLLPLLTRILDPLEYGRVVSFSLLVTLSMAVAGFNAHAALGVVWFQRRREELYAFISMALLLAVASTLAVSCFVYVFLSAFPQLASGITPWWGAIAALTAGANIIFQCRIVLWQSQQKPLQSACLQFISSLTNVGLSLLAVCVFQLGADGRNLGISAASFIMAFIAVFCFVISRELIWAPKLSHLKTLIAFGSPLILHIFAGVLLSSADRWSISIKLDAYSLGIYGAGAQLGMTMTIIADAFVKAYSPWLYAKLASTEQKDKYCAVGAIYIAVPGFIIAALILGLALKFSATFLLGAKYSEATHILYWFMLGGAFNGIYVCTSVLFFFSGRTGLLAMTTLSASVIGAFSTWYLVSFFGINGAAIGFTFSQVLLAMLVTLIAVKNFDLPWFEPRRAFVQWFSAVRESFGLRLA